MEDIFHPGTTKEQVRSVALQAQHHLSRNRRVGQVIFDAVAITSEVEYITLILNRGRNIESLGIQGHECQYIAVVVGVKPLPEARWCYERRRQLLLDSPYAQW